MAISKIIYKTSAQDTGTVWMDATSATAAAADITAPKTAMLADGVMTTGTGSGGGGSSFTLLYSDEETVSTTSTSNTAVATLSTGITFGAGETYLVSIRDKAGERNGYFYGSDSYFYVKSNSFSNGTVLYGVCYWLDSSGNIDFSNTIRGVFLYRYYGGSNMGQIQINSRYDSSKGIVNGTFTIKVYKVTTPEPVT